jgi:hypothetical protein
MVRVFKLEKPNPSHGNFKPREGEKQAPTVIVEPVRMHTFDYHISDQILS